jgi:dynein heavy chain
LTKKNLLKNSSAGLIRDMQSFGEFKDKLTDESVELAENYLNQEEWFNIEVLTAL